MKKTVFVSLFSLFLLFVCGVSALGVTYEPEGDDVGVLYLESLDNGEVLCAKNADERVSPASITKIVPAIITLENCENLNQEIRVPAVCINALEGTNSSTVDLVAGETLTLRQLLGCMLVSSANDAANVIAHYVGNGSIDTFVDMMNQFAANLGCTGTHFTNAHGLDDPEHYTTANDLAKIYRYCLKNSMFSQISGTLDYEVPSTNKSKARKLRNTNSLLNSGIPDYYYEYAKGGKTGTTDEAGRCLVSWASKDGYNYMCIAMNGKFYDYDEDGVDENMAFVASKQAYEWVFKNIRLREVANPETAVSEIKVRLASKTDHLALAPGHSVSVLVPADVDSSSVYIEPYPTETPDEVFAPVKKGDVLGKAAVKYAGEVIADVELVAAADVNPSVIKYVGHLLAETFTSKTFIICAALVLLIAFPAMVWLFAIYPVTHRKKRNAVHMVSLKGIAEARRNERGDSKKKHTLNLNLDGLKKVGVGGKTEPRKSAAAAAAADKTAARTERRKPADPFDIGWMPEGMEDMQKPSVLEEKDPFDIGEIDPLSESKTTVRSRPAPSGKTTAVKKRSAAKSGEEWKEDDWE